MRRQWLLVLTVIVVLLGAGVSAYWYFLARRLSDGFSEWSDAQRAAGWTITASDRALAGWPRAATTAVTGFRIAGGRSQIPGGMSWSADRLLLTVELLHPDVLIVSAEGTQGIGAADGPGIGYAAKLSRAVLQLTQPGAPVAIRIQSLKTQRGGLSIGQADALLALDSQASAERVALGVKLSASSIVLPSDVNWPLGPHLSAVGLNLALSGPVPPPQGLASEARVWRDGHGVLQVPQLDLHWGPLDAQISARATLDDRLQPIAEGRATARNYAPTLDALAAHRVIGNDAALAAKAVLSLLARMPAGGAPEVEIPFTLRDGSLAARGIPLMKLPPVRWPESP